MYIDVLNNFAKMAVAIYICVSIIIFELNYNFGIRALQINKTHHNRHDSENEYYKKLIPAYRSFQPASVKYHKVYPRKQERVDYDIPSYDTEYGGVVSNFTSSIYDDNPPLYPNPEVMSRSNQVYTKVVQNRVPDVTEIDIPDDSLADADLKEHNIIDSVTYLYGFNSCHGVRTEWIVLIFITGFISLVLVGFTIAWLIWSDYAKEFRTHSKLYPISINLGCCLEACTLIYMQAVMGISAPSYCEKIALLLHYTYLVCSIWIIVLAASITEYSHSNTIIPLKYHYLLAYGVPAIYVMFNYAISLEQYEIKHYCWMSIEKGMVLGFMAPATLLILLNTGLAIVGLHAVNERQARALAQTIQDMVDHHIANWPRAQAQEEQLNNMYSPTAHGSRKYADSSDSLDKEYYNDDGETPELPMETHCNELRIDLEGGEGGEGAEGGEGGEGAEGGEGGEAEEVTWCSAEGGELRTYLNLCLVLEPFFAINWVMGVVAIENASHWATPAIYLVLVTCMHAYLAATLSMTLPILRTTKENDLCCEEVIAEPTLTRSRTTDNIPLLDPGIQQQHPTPAPADTISTISI